MSDISGRHSLHTDEGREEGVAATSYITVYACTHRNEAVDMQSSRAAKVLESGQVPGCGYRE